MGNQMQHGNPFPMLFPFLFVGMWLVISLILSAASGWFALRWRYPDRPEPALRTIHMQSGTMDLA
jgi:hypothetical protein